MDQEAPVLVGKQGALRHHAARPLRSGNARPDPVGHSGWLHCADGSHSAVGSASDPRPCAADRLGQPLLRRQVLLRRGQRPAVPVDRMGLGMAGGAGEPSSDPQDAAKSAGPRIALVLLRHRNRVVLSMVVRRTYDPRHHRYRNAGLLRTPPPQSCHAVEVGELVHRALHRRIRSQPCRVAASQGRGGRMPHSRLVWVEAGVRGDRNHDAASRRGISVQKPNQSPSQADEFRVSRGYIRRHIPIPGTQALRAVLRNRSEQSRGGKGSDAALGARNPRLRCVRRTPRKTRGRSPALGHLLDRRTDDSRRAAIPAAK